MPAGHVDRNVLSSNYQQPGDIYQDGKTEGAFEVVAQQVDSNWDDYAAQKAELSSTAAGDSGAHNVGSAPIDGVTGTNVYAQMAELKNQINGLVVGAIPPGSIAKDAESITISDTGNHFTAINVEGALNELFLNADNGQRSIANVVGSPTVAGDTYAKISTDIRTQMDTMFANINSKGVPATSADTLAQLATKIGQISTGKRFASGVATATGSYTYSYIGTGTMAWGAGITVTGLSFKPSFIYVYISTATLTSVIIYSEFVNGGYPKTVKIISNMNNTTGSITSYHLKGDVSPISVVDGSFSLPGFSGSNNWIAFE